MEKQIIEALDLQRYPEILTNVNVDGKHVDFSINGVRWWAKLSRGRFNEDSMRRAI